jgi:hypothetical protein
VSDLAAHEAELAHDHLTICFGDGTIRFYPDTVDPERLASRLSWFLSQIDALDWVSCAAGACHNHRHGRAD